MDKKRLEQEFQMDLGRSLEELMLKEQVYEMLLKVTVNVTNTSLNTLDAALREQNRPKIDEVAHELKGVFANMRLVYFSSLAARMNDLAGTGDMAEISRLASEFRARFNVLEEIANAND